MKILDVPRSGSYAGVTSSHNRAGQYVRNRRTPTNTPTARRTTIRSAFGAASSGWSSLTDAQRAAWQAAADAHPITDALGQSIKLTGHQLYVSVNTQLVQVGSSPVATPPSDFSVFDLTGSTGTFSVAGGCVLALNGAGGDDDFVLISFSKPLPAGRSSSPTYSQQSVVSGSTTAETITTATYAAIFGTPVAGQKVFVKLTPVSQYGVTGVPLVLAITVT